jgi:hypothetical protein
VPEHRRVDNRISLEAWQTYDLWQPRMLLDRIEKGSHDIVDASTIDHGIRRERLVVWKRFQKCRYQWQIVVPSTPRIRRNVAARFPRPMPAKHGSLQNLYPSPRVTPPDA